MSDLSLWYALSKKLSSEYDMYLRLLSLAYYFFINVAPSLCKYEEFAECTWLPYSCGLTSGSICRLLQKIDNNKTSRFLKKRNDKYRRQVGDGITERKFWVLDSSSITHYIRTISLRLNTDTKDLFDAPRINVLLIVDQKTGNPIYYRNFDSNVPDISALRNSLDELAMTMTKIDCKNAVLVTDKGYTFSNNWDDMLRNLVSFISNAIP